ncbi:helix-turn-helix transcriptional regulator [Arthrobacter woluwensis]|uniref:helix-turn-helix transcriptional regulator n=1 Tax=Arthrobacter woluwensis TaxID=156980 RepID=UPI001AAE7FA1|nr:helix-turn-helix domain-containing protein [Arthrobacter woluwensis]
MVNPELVSTREVAAALGVNTRQVARLVSRGELTPSVKAPGTRGAFLFDRAEIEKLQEAHGA